MDRIADNMVSTAYLSARLGVPFHILEAAIVRLGIEPDLQLNGVFYFRPETVDRLSIAARQTMMTKRGNRHE